MPGYGEIIQGEGNPILNSLRKSLQTIGSTKLAEKLRKKQEQDALKNKLKEVILSGVISGNVRPKLGADISNFDVGDDFGATLGQVSAGFEPIPKTPAISTTITPWGLGDLAEASNIIEATPEMLAADNTTKNMVVQSGETPGGWFGWGKKPIYKYTPGTERIRAEAQKILSSPGRVTMRGGNPFMSQAQGSIDESTGLEEADEETQTLLEEYNTTDDPDRLSELKKILEQKGVVFQ